MSERGLLYLAVVCTVAWTIGPPRHSRADSASRAGCRDSAAVILEPAAPTRGALFRVRVVGVAPNAQLTGEVAGERLHFATDSGANTSFAPVPIDSPDSVRIVVRCSAGFARSKWVWGGREYNGTMPGNVGRRIR